MTLMPFHYNLCSNLASKEGVTGRWLMFQVTKHFKNICRFKIHHNMLPLCYLWLHCEMRLGDSGSSNLKHESNIWEYSKQKIRKSIILAFLNEHFKSIPIQLLKTNNASNNYKNQIQKCIDWRQNQIPDEKESSLFICRKISPELLFNQLTWSQPCRQVTAGIKGTWLKCKV